MSDGEPPIPVFVVVGNVNQGKSSVVAALTEDAGVPIARYPGTTQRCADYAFQLDGEVVFRIVDSPGFQQAREALEWMRTRAVDPSARRRAVEDFVAAHRDGGHFVDEVELLQPILGGAGILYVVDASGRFQPSNEAEMEILRWTGQPGMALLNRTRERAFEDEWRPVLNQFFNLVRSFDAHGAKFEDRVDLLRGFREVQPAWRAAMDRAIAAMEREHAQRTARTVSVLTDHLVRALSHVEQLRLRDDERESDHRVELERRYLEHLRRLEVDARSAVERIYGHLGVERGDAILELLHADLFSEESWKAFGLSRKTLMGLSAGIGALAGGGLDLVVGGASFGLGAALGAGLGAVGAWFGPQVADTWTQSSRLASALFPGDTGRFLCMGPATNPAFHWVLTDRALVHAVAVRDRAHSRQDALATPRVGTSEGAGVAAHLSPEQRRDLDAVLRAVTKQALGGRVADQTRESLRGVLTAIMSAR